MWNFSLNFQVLLLIISYVSFLNPDFHGSRVTSDNGPRLVRDFDECLGLTAVISSAVL